MFSTSVTDKLSSWHPMLLDFSCLHPLIAVQKS
jgi:hypothetical protein